MTQSILIVDDSELTRLSHAAIVESLGDEVVLAENGMQALELLTHHRVDMIIADLNMPVMDGYTFIESVRGYDDFHAIPIVVASTESQAADRRRAMEAGADVYLVKPVTASAIRECIALLLEDHE